MRTFRKVIGLLLVLVMSFSIFTGCKEKSTVSENNKEEKTTTSETNTATSNENEKLEYAKLTIILFGNMSNRMKELIETVYNPMLLEKINAELDVQYLPWGEYGPGKKVDLMLAAGEKFDAVLTDGTWAAANMQKGYLAELSGVADQYLVDHKKVNDQKAFDTFTFDGGLYAIPIGNKPKADTFRTVSVRQDLLKEVGMDSIQSIEDLDKFAYSVKEKYPEYYATMDIEMPQYILRGISDRNLMLAPSPYKGILIEEDAHQLISLVDAPEFKATVDLYNKWFKDDLIPKDVLTNKEGNVTRMQNGGFVFFRGTSGTTVLENLPKLQEIVPTGDLKEYALKPEKPKYKLQYESTAFAVPVYSKNQDRIMMVLNLMQQDAEMINLFAYGVEGVDYEIIDNKIHRLQNDELFYQWMLFNVKISQFEEAFPNEFIEDYRAYDDDALTSTLFGFTLDREPIKSEIAKIDAVWAEYATPMLAGILSYEDGIDNLKTELERAGYEKYLQEIQKQFDAFKASQK